MQRFWDSQLTDAPASPDRGGSPLVLPLKTWKKTFNDTGDRMSSRDTPPARPIFRRLAAGLAALCFVLALVFVIFLPKEGWFGPGVCAFVGFVMATIATTGHWPPRHPR